MTTPIRMAFFVRSPVEYTSLATNAFTITPAGRWKHLQRLAHWILKRTGALTQHWCREALVKEIALDYDKTVLHVIMQAQTQITQCADRKIEAIYVGPKQLDELAHNCINDYGWLGVSGFDIRQTPNMEYRLWNVPVKVIPWMDGVLVV